MQQESDWNPNAVSSTGAEGISQFEPYTWPTWSDPGQSPFDPAAAIPAQGRFDCALAKQMDAAQAAGKLPNTIPVTNLMLAAYNAGAGAGLAAHGIPQNGQTPVYVIRITTNAANFGEFAQFQTTPPPARCPLTRSSNRPGPRPGTASTPTTTSPSANSCSSTPTGPYGTDRRGTPPC